ncbi:MAG: type II secretion system F family protein [Planctomycetaceae bacterium]|nr:type II secretion system F family protein [Planctomycetaceae bacterium]
MLFASQSPHGWLRNTAIPKLEPHDVPSVDSSDYAFGPMTPTLAAFFPETDDARRAAVRELQQSGDYAPHARENLAATRFVFMFGALLFGGVCVVFAPPALELPLLIGMAVLTALGWALLALIVKSKAESRRTEVERAIPDLMDVLNMCVGQGLTVPDALLRVARDLKPVHPALAQEMSIVVDQAKVGTLHESLQNFAERFDLPQVQSFVSLMTQTERLGTSVSEALTEYADNMRENLRQRADERANQASFSLLFPTVLCLMPAVFLFLMGPALIELSKFNSAGGLSALSEGRNAARNLNRQQSRGNPGVRGGDRL